MMDKNFLYNEIRVMIQKLTNKVECHRIMFNGNIEDFNTLTNFNISFLGLFQEILQQSIMLNIGYLFDKDKKTCSLTNLIESWKNKKSITDIKNKYLKLKEEIESLNLIKARHNIFAHRNSKAIHKGTFMDPSILKVSHFEIATKKIQSFFYEFENFIYKDSDKFAVGFDKKAIKEIIHNLLTKCQKFNLFETQ